MLSSVNGLKPSASLTSSLPSQHRLLPSRPSKPSSLLSQSPKLPPAFSSSSSSSVRPWIRSNSTSTIRNTQPFTHSSAAAAAQAAVSVPEQDSSSTALPLQQKQKLRVAVKAMEKPKIVLKFLWMEKNIGLAVDQEIPGHGTIPLSPYYFWPRKDAWEELKVLLESKPWISNTRMVLLLNQATDIINLWQQSGGGGRGLL